MTYAAFLMVFLVPPIVLLALVFRRRMTRRWARGVVAVMVLAVTYTGPWDNYIIEQGVWSYPPGRVMGVGIGRVPLEEYAFMLLQVALTALCLLAFRSGPATPRPPVTGQPPPLSSKGG